MGTLPAPPTTPLSHAHSSAFSWPVLWLVQPPAGFWSVMVSEYSWPRVIVQPSRVPALPELRKFTPQPAPESMLYGWLLNGKSPTSEAIAPPVSVVSPL